MNDKEKCLVDVSTLTGVSNWSLLPITEFGFELSKQPFWDSTKLRNGWEDMQSTNICPCGRKFDIQHSMNCKKFSFIYIQLNDLRDLTANMMSEACKDTNRANMLANIWTNMLAYMLAVCYTIFSQAKSNQHSWIFIHSLVDYLSRMSECDAAACLIITS